MNGYQAILAYSTLPGAAGGLAIFLYAIRRGRIRNNKHVRKALLDVGGAMLVASFVALPFGPLPEHSTRVMLASFIAGLFWTNTIEIIRERLTQMVLVALRAVLQEPPSQTQSNDPPSGEGEP